MVCVPTYQCKLTHAATYIGAFSLVQLDASDLCWKRAEFDKFSYRIA